MNKNIEYEDQITHSLMLEWAKDKGREASYRMECGGRISSFGQAAGILLSALEAAEAALEYEQSTQKEGYENITAAMRKERDEWKQRAESVEARFREIEKENEDLKVAAGIC
jgi:hypothetical protein